MWVIGGVGKDAFLVWGRGYGIYCTGLSFIGRFIFKLSLSRYSLVLFRIKLVMALVGSNCIRNRS